MSTFFATANDIPYAPRNGWQLFRALSAGKFMPGTAWQDRRYRRKFLLLRWPFSLAAALSMRRYTAACCPPPAPTGRRTDDILIAACACWVRAGGHFDA